MQIFLDKPHNSMPRFKWSFSSLSLSILALLSIALLSTSFILSILLFHNYHFSRFAPSVPLYSAVILLLSWLIFLSAIATFFKTTSLLAHEVIAVILITFDLAIFTLSISCLSGGDFVLELVRRLWERPDLAIAEDLEK
jgi:4-amino-4-deoxy-L-arabinose transferase-like glycosyltransferase